MPGAMAKGTLTQTPTSNVPKQEARAVTVMRAPLSMPVAPRMFGFRNRM